MAGRYRRVHVRIWNDEMFLSLSPDAKLTWFYFLTNEDINPAGIGLVSPDSINAILGNNQHQCNRCYPTDNGCCDNPAEHIAEGITKGLTERFAILSEYVGPKILVILKNFMLHNAPENPNTLLSWIDCCSELPKSKLYQELLNHLTKELGGQPKWLFSGLLEPLANNQLRGLKEHFWKRTGMRNPSENLGEKSKPIAERSAKRITKGTAKRMTDLTVTVTDTVTVNKELELSNSKEESTSSRARSRPENNGSVPEQIERIRFACGKYPAKGLWPALIPIVGSQKQEELKSKFDEWSLHGWNPKNFKGWIEYDPSQPFNGRNSKQPSSEESRCKTCRNNPYFDPETQRKQKCPGCGVYR